MDFLRVAGKLKQLARQGWVDRGVADAESVADHTFRVALMAWMLGEAAGLDTGRLVKLALVHDLAEAEVGDLTPYAQILDGGVPLEEALTQWRTLLGPNELAAARRLKHKCEAAALEGLVAGLSGSLRDEISDLFAEYREGCSMEARFVAQIDKLESLLQAIEYREAGHDSDVENFLATAREVVDHPVLASFLGELENVRRQ